MPPSSSPLLPTFDQEEVESPPGEEEVDEPLRLHLVETSRLTRWPAVVDKPRAHFHYDFHRCAL